MDDDDTEDGDEDWEDEEEGDPEILYTWAGKCVRIDCEDTEIRDPDSGECFTMSDTCPDAYTALCDPENEWAEIWDSDEWASGCVSNPASFFNAELVEEEDVEE